MQSATLTIEGMHCDGCARTIDYVLRRQPGVWETEVSLADARARVLFEPARVTDEELAAAVEQAGYRVIDRGA